jgi:hypothetical protein
MGGVFEEGGLMLIVFNEGTLTLSPQNDADRTTLLEQFGTPDTETDGRGKREFRQKAFGLAIHLNEDGHSVDIGVRDAWWNYDD